MNFFRFNQTKKEIDLLNLRSFESKASYLTKHQLTADFKDNSFINEVIANQYEHSIDTKKEYKLEINDMHLLSKNAYQRTFENLCILIYFCIKYNKLFADLKGSLLVDSTDKSKFCNDFIKSNKYKIKLQELHNKKYLDIYIKALRKLRNKAVEINKGVNSKIVDITSSSHREKKFANKIKQQVDIVQQPMIDNMVSTYFLIPTHIMAFSELTKKIKHGIEYYQKKIDKSIDIIKYNKSFRKALGLEEWDKYSNIIRHLSRGENNYLYPDNIISHIISFNFTYIYKALEVCKKDEKEVSKFEQIIIEDRIRQDLDIQI